MMHDDRQGGHDDALLSSDAQAPAANDARNGEGARPDPDHAPPCASTDADDDLRHHLSVGRKAFLDLAWLRWWCAWRIERATNKNGTSRQTKAPYIATAREVHARVNQPSCWLSRARADDLATCFDAQGYRAGVGVLLGQRLDDGFCLVAVDLDACRDPSTGLIASWAMPVLEAFAAATYCETSPSGSGAHAVFLLHEDDIAQLRTVSPGLKENGGKWRRASGEGEKAAGVELLLGGYVTVTERWLPQSRPTIRPVKRAVVEWLLLDFLPTFIDAPSIPPANSRSHPTGPPSRQAPREPDTPPPDSGVPQPTEQMFRFSTGRLTRFARGLDDAGFQTVAAYWTVARRSSPGWFRAGIDRERLVQLPGSDKASRRGWGTIVRARRWLVEAEVMRKVSEAIPPLGAPAGRTAEFEVEAPLVHDHQHVGPRADIRRMLRAEWQFLVWSLPPFALRVGCWLLARQDPAATFEVSTAEVARTFDATEPRAASAIAALVGPVLEEMEPPDPRRRRPGLYRLRPGLLVERADGPRP